MEWILTRLGNASGSVAVNGETVRLSHSQQKEIHFPDLTMENLQLSFHSERGKLGDSEESLLFFCTAINPAQENFALSASFTVTDADRYPGWQAGYGIFVADTLASERGACRFRNLLSVGRHRGLSCDAYGCGLRVAAGHRDPAAASADIGRRKLDASRNFSGADWPTVLQTGERLRLTLSKTNRGFTASVRRPGEEEKLFFPGCDFLTAQEPAALYVGFGVAGNLSVRVEEIQFHSTAGKLSHTPAFAIKNRVPDYPFSRALLGSRPKSRLQQKMKGALCAAPEGSPDGDGTRENPLDLQTALSRAGTACHITLLDGVYFPEMPYQTRPAGPFRIGRERVTVKAEHADAVILDGSKMKVKAPVMILRGDYHTIQNLTFRCSPSAGLMICGNSNTVEGCRAYENGDTGILICAYPGTSQEAWPKNNTVFDCESYGNCDTAHCNADGFGAKLSVGEGNRFLCCTAHHNVDDGFDLYTKRNIGPIGPVLLEECVAYENGRMEAGRAAGSGFKLGGEDVAVPHIIRNCRAHGNQLYGFSSNSNPSLHLAHLDSRENGKNTREDNYQLPSLLEGGDWTVEDLQPDVGIPEKSVLMFLVPRASGGGAEKVLVSLASQLAEEHKVYLVTTIREDGTENYPYSEKLTYLNVYHWAKRSEAEKETETAENRSDTAGQQLSDRIHLKVRKALGTLAIKLLPVAVEPAKKQVENADFSFQIQSVREMKKAFGVTCAISFLNSANYINVMSCVGERTIVSIRSYPESRYAPPDNWSEDGRKRIAAVCQRADWIVPVSKETADCIAWVYDAPAEKLRVIYNGVDLEEISRKGKEPLENPELAGAIEKAGFVFVSPGRLTEKKGQWHLIRAFREILKRHPDALLIIPGRPGKGKEDVADYLRQVIEENGMEDRVLLPGFCRNPYALLARCDAFVSASFNEGFPNALVEAMAVGLPVISTDCRSGPREILAPESDYHDKTAVIDCAEYGVLVPECSGNKFTCEPLEAEEAFLAQAMLKFINDPEIYQCYKERSLMRAQQFTAKNIVKKWLLLTKS